MQSKIFTGTIYTLILGIAASYETKEIIYFFGIFLAGVSMFPITYYQDADKANRPKWWYRLACMFAACYAGYFWYPSVKEFRVMGWQPFVTIHIWIGFCSYSSVEFFRNIKTVRSFGFKYWLAKIGDKLSAISKEK